MVERRTIKLPEDDFERHNKERQRAGLTWAEYIDGEAPELPEILFKRMEFDTDKRVDYDRISEIVREETRRVLEEARR